MILFPQAKINLGLNVVAKRADGYHDLETVFYPVPLCDALEVLPMDERFPSATDCDVKVSHDGIGHGLTRTDTDENRFDTGDEQKNLVVKAYHLLKEERPDIPRVHIHLYKGIPTQSGMGGGSSDCASMLLLMNEMARLGLTQEELIERAARLGADCPIFIINRPAYAEGIGERLQPVDLNLSGWLLAVMRPDIAVSTKEAFSLITPKRPVQNCRDIVMGHPVEEWRGLLENDFEQSVFALHPEIAEIKERLYELGAAYSAMSGSGSAVFGLFRQSVDLSSARARSHSGLLEQAQQSAHLITTLAHHFPGIFTRLLKL